MNITPEDDARLRLATYTPSFFGRTPLSLQRNQINVKNSISRGQVGLLQQPTYNFVDNVSKVKSDLLLMNVQNPDDFFLQLLDWFV